MMNEFIKLSKYAGMREDLVQAGGGNSSLKVDGHRMLVKASGIQLADISQNEGFSVVDYPLLVQYMERLVHGESMESEKEILDNALLEGKRPSIETFLHAITGNVTLHVHSVAVNVLASRMNGLKELTELFPEAITVGYATPGLSLARLCYESYQKSARERHLAAKIIFLKNHGVIISGDTADEVINLTDEVNYRIEQLIGMDNLGYHHAYDIFKVFKGLDEEKIVVQIENKKILDAYEKFNHQMWDFQISPDSIVFCGKQAFEYRPDHFIEDFQEYSAENGMPILVQYGRSLFIRAESVKKAREIESVLALSAQVALFNQNKKLDLLSETEQNFLLNWDAEKYRQRIK